MDKEHFKKVSGYLKRGKAIVGGKTEQGCYVPPTIIDDVKPGDRLAREEVFGPVLTVQPFDSEEEAVARANGTRYGLAAGVQTTDIARAHRVAAQLEAGIVWVNGWALLDPSIPFGGVRNSGWGRESGEEALLSYTRSKSVVIALG